MARLRAAPYVAVVVIALALVSRVHATEISVSQWWLDTYGGAYGTFDDNWEWVNYDVWHDGNADHQLGLEVAGWANQNTFGYYDYTDDTYNQLIAGPVSPGDPPQTVTLPASKLFDFYLRNSAYTWHTNEALESVADPYQHHAWVFKSKNSAWLDRPGVQDGYQNAYLIAWEDLPRADYDPLGNPKGWTQGSPFEPDNNDMVVMLWVDGLTGDPVPEPGSMGLLALALCGAVAAGRKRLRK